MDKAIEEAEQLITEADAVLVTAGAGMGVDSGLPDFRGEEGFWKAYPVLGRMNIDFQQMARPSRFLEDPQLAWGFYGHRLDLYRRTVPHEGFQILLQLAEKKEHGAFVVTSNVDGQFQKAGFPAQRICEVHGSIHRLQCMEGACSVWAADAFQPKVDEASCRLISELPHCPQCGSIARPNILMFSDWGWNEQSTVMQRKRLEAWLAGVGRLVTIEIGAGKEIPTIRSMGERMEGKLIRINPTDCWMRPDKGVSLEMGGLDALNQINSAF